MNFGFNFDTDYDQSTSKHIPLENFDLNLTDDGDDFTKDELKRLLGRLEADLQTKEDVIEKLKAERNKVLLHDAKYGKLCVHDPMLALKRDSSITEEMLDERQLGQLYESQLLQLENLIAFQRKTQNKAKLLLSSAEKRHFKALRELELEKERKSRYAEQGDDVLALLEKERNKLTKQLEYQMSQFAVCQEERHAMERRLEAEKEKHKTMVLFLINERKQLLMKLHEMKLKSENQPTAPAAQDVLVDELKKEVAFLRQERDILLSNKKQFQAENLSLKEIIKGQEGDLASLRRNMLSNTKLTLDKVPTTTLPHLSDERSLVMANRLAGTNSAASSSNQARTRLATSTSFPSERSRLPRAPFSPSRTPTGSARTPSSPTKKVPAMGIGTIRHRVPPPSSLETGLEQLDAALQAMTMEGANVAPSSPTKRSSSLPRGTSEPRPPPSISSYPSSTEPRPARPQMGSRIVPPTKPELPSRKTTPSSIKNGLSSLSRNFTGK